MKAALVDALTSTQVLVLRWYAFVVKMLRWLTCTHCARYCNVIFRSDCVTIRHLYLEIIPIIRNGELVKGYKKTYSSQIGH